MAVTGKRRLTADEFFALPGEQTHTELIDGEIVVDSPTTRHQDIVLWLAARLLWFAEANPGLGRPGLELGTVIDDDNVYLPDVWWTAPAHSPELDHNRHSGVPDLVVEVRSPTTWSKDRGQKKDGYEAAGVPELWLVDWVAEIILVFRRSSPAAATFDVEFAVGEGDTLTTPIISGFELDVTALFDR